MQIAIDGRELCGRVTGVGRYLAHLLEEWERLPDARPHRFVVYVPAGAQMTSGAMSPAEGGRRFPQSLEIRTIGGGSGTWWEQVRLPAALRRDRPDVLFSPAYTAPLATRIPVVLTLHDLSFVAHPEWFPRRSGLRRRVVARLSARRARQVLTDAEFSRGEVVARLGVPRDKIQVIPLGVTRRGRMVASAAEAAGPAVEAPPDVRAATTGPGLQPCARPLVLFVGSIFNRRHLPELIRAVAPLAGRLPGLRLEIVGDDRTYPPQDLRAIAVQAGVAEATTIRSYVTDEALDQLYARAGVFAFLSDYEGFGFTPLEALSAGVPILVGDTPVAREVYQDAAIYSPTTDVATITRELERLLRDASARAALLARAPSLLARYSWERAARQTLAALVEAGRG